MQPKANLSGLQTIQGLEDRRYGGTVTFVAVANAVTARAVE